jgi:hypothetical protein
VYRFKNYIAFFLLLLFVRVLVPETAVLGLHGHEHTEDHGKADAGLKLEKKHQHCHIEHLFNAPFSPAPQVSVKTLLISFTDTYSASNAFIWKFTFPNNTDLRGPPVA